MREAFTKRGQTPPHISVAISAGPPESYVIRPEKITGGDERGLMYGLLEAAEQVRRSGRIIPAQERPATAIRGIRQFIHNQVMERAWYYSKVYWDTFFSTLAHDRLNRFNLVFAHQTNYMAPPYPYWVTLPEFPEVRVPSVSAEQRQENLEMLCYISHSAAEHGVDFTLGIWEHNAREDESPTATGITNKNIGPYSYAALKKVLQTCTAIRSVQVRTNSESGIPEPQQVSFYRDWVYRALKDAGRPVTLDLRGWLMSPDMLDAAVHAGVPLRLSSKYWVEHLGRPYQPVETFKTFSYLDFLKKPRPYQFYWEIWALGTDRVLLWGDPEYVRRAAPTFLLSGSEGFEIDAPLAQKGYGNGSEPFDIFESNAYTSFDKRKFWTWEFQRYWMFYRLWGRLTYNPKATADVWMDEMRERFGDAADEIMSAYEHASRVLPEIVAAHTIDPNMFIWPEINPGGLIAAYKDVKPSDQSFIASPAEAAANEAHGNASAKQGPRETAALLDDLASHIEKTVREVDPKLADHREWQGTKPDMQVLAYLARYHARKQEAAYSLSWFYETGDFSSLGRTEAQLASALEIWRGLVRLTDGLYPDEMIFGPTDIGHWKDKLPYVENDVAWIRELQETVRKYGSYDFRYEFSGHVPSPGPGPSRDGSFVNESSIEPRFTLVGPDSQYSEQTRYGWFGNAGAAPAKERILTPYEEIESIQSRPQQLPINVLLGGGLSIPNHAIFRVRTGDGSVEVVTLYPDGSEAKQKLAARDGVVDVKFPADEPREISALLLRNLTGTPSPPTSERYPKVLPRPMFLHTPPAQISAGKPLKLTIRVEPGTNVTQIRLHYRALNALEPLRTLETSGPDASFTIPSSDVSANWDLLYYFEVLNTENSGWFWPDPVVTTPYYVVSLSDHPERRQ